MTLHDRHHRISRHGHGVLLAISLVIGPTLAANAAPPTVQQAAPPLLPCDGYEFLRDLVIFDVGPAIVEIRAIDEDDSGSKLPPLRLHAFRRRGGVFVLGGKRDKDPIAFRIESELGSRLEHCPVKRFEALHNVRVDKSMLSERGHVFLATPVPDLSSTQLDSLEARLAQHPADVPTFDVREDSDFGGASWCESENGPVMRELWFHDEEDRISTWIALPQTLAESAPVQTGDRSASHLCDEVPCRPNYFRREVERKKKLFRVLSDGLVRWFEARRIPLDPFNTYLELSILGAWPLPFTMVAPLPLDLIHIRRQTSPTEWTSIDFIYHMEGGTRIEFRRDDRIDGDAIELDAEWRPVAREHWFDGVPDGAWWEWSNDMSRAWVAHFIAGRRVLEDWGPVYVTH